MKTYTVSIISCLFFITVGVSCKKRAEEDPCAKFKPFKTDFTMKIREQYSRAKGGDTLIEIQEGDTISDGYIQFAAIDNIPYTDIYDSVRWLIGNAQNSFTTRNIQLYFRVNEFNMPISLTGYKKKITHLNCFPNDPSFQTVTKTISVVKLANIAVVGKFFGYNEDSPADTFTIENHFEPGRGLLAVKNFPKGNRGFPPGFFAPPTEGFIGIFPSTYGYDYIFFDSQNGDAVSTPTHGPIFGIAKVTGRNKITINYEQYENLPGYYGIYGPWGNLRKRKFVGYRVP
ncbi:MAG: hypothetical protein EAZ47_05735 [Bacteroidetes bacterium]|nr:MAG: hypothetical protein EAY72_05590 [Bacteroidota bacterium]TAE70817.1 MAG: hypothetical protein EAY68_02535 [Bacteroidota bacterium]TAF93713.1 MAG: hypothetical protein EAZ47_05735 [Bacteroidota bacterium]